MSGLQGRKQFAGRSFQEEADQSLSWRKLRGWGGREGGGPGPGQGLRGLTQSAGHQGQNASLPRRALCWPGHPRRLEEQGAERRAALGGSCRFPRQSTVQPGAAGPGHVGLTGAWVWVAHSAVPSIRAGDVRDAGAAGGKRRARI